MAKVSAVQEQTHVPPLTEVWLHQQLGASLGKPLETSNAR
jgi:hypothetical protein